MAVAPQFNTAPITADDLLAMPADARYELIRGELVEMPPPPGSPHGKLTDRLASRASVFARDNDLGEGFSECGFLIERGPDTMLAPDWAFVAKHRLPPKETKGYFPLAPDVVLETRSPSDSPREVALKAAQWIAAGVRMAWVLDGDALTLTIHRPNQPPRVLHAKDTLTGEDVLPGFELPLMKVFQ
jgi:Uma2 family endonuclease